MTAGLSVDVNLQLGSFGLEVRLDVPAGETLAVLGPNGAGKSTLLRCIAGLTPLDSGTIVLDDEVLEDPSSGTFVEPEHRAIGFVFQDYQLFPHLSALDNIAFGLRCRGVGRREARRDAREWMARMGLEAQADAHPAQLSGGQAQRVALARALATTPRLLLLDEPLSALDATTRAQTRRSLRNELAGYDGVRLVVTHDPVEASALADRVVVLEAGQVIQIGTLAELTAHPRSRYVADLVGVNRLTGRGDGDRIVLGPDAALTAAERVSGDVVAMIHPRAVILHQRQPEGSPRNVWRGTVAGIDGASDRVRVEVSGPIPIVAEVTSGALAELGLIEGSPVWVSVKATEITVFAA